MAITPGSDIEATDIVISAEAGEALSARDAVYIKTSDGKAYKADADAIATCNAIGFAIAAASMGATVYIRHDGNMGGFSGLTQNALYYVSGTAGAITATKPTYYKLMGQAISSSVIKLLPGKTKRTTVFNVTGSDIGSSTTRFDITNPAGTTFRYTFDGTGTDPNINSGTYPIGSAITFNAQNFSAGNNGTFIVTGVGANYVEVTNASGVAENDKTIGTGYVRPAQVYTKTPGLIYAEVEVQAGGGTADTSTSGGGGAYAKKVYYDGDLSDTTAVEVGGATRQSLFKAIVAGPGTTGSGGTATGGDINLPGQDGQASQSISKPSTSSTNYIGGDGGDSMLGHGGQGTRNSGSPGSMGGGGNGKNYGGGGGVASGTGAEGIIIITEYY